MTAADALAFFGRKYDELSFEVALLRQRLQTGHATPDDAGKALDPLRMGGVYGFLTPSVAAAGAAGEWQRSTSSSSGGGSRWC